MARSAHAFTVCLAALCAASQAGAMQITNRDASDHKLVVTESGASKDMIVKPSQVLADICVKGCTIKMSDGEEYEFDGTELVSIEEGLLFLDEPPDESTDAGNLDTSSSDAVENSPKKSEQ
jgi:hypothetical protein